MIAAVGVDGCDVLPNAATNASISAAHVRSKCPHFLKLNAYTAARSNPSDYVRMYCNQAVYGRYRKKVECDEEHVALITFVPEIDFLSQASVAYVPLVT